MNLLRAYWKTRMRNKLALAAIPFVFWSCVTAGESARQEQAAEQARQEEARQAQRALEEEARVEREAANLEQYGFRDRNEFGQACRDAIAEASGSDEFGIWNTEQWEAAGFWLMRQRVYGRNVFGAEVEQTYKCWNAASTGLVEIEHEKSAVR